jgi:hypothetical protein
MDFASQAAQNRDQGPGQAVAQLAQAVAQVAEATGDPRVQQAAELLAEAAHGGGGGGTQAGSAQAAEGHNTFAPPGQLG